MPTTERWTEPSDEKSRAEAQIALRRLLTALREAEKAAKILNGKAANQKQPRWMCLSARHKDESLVLTRKDRKLLAQGMPEIAKAANQVMWRVGFVSGSQSKSDEKPSDEL
jgi:hypothetical protein